MKFILVTLMGAFLMLSVVTACQTAAPTSISKIPSTPTETTKKPTENPAAHADDNAPRISLADAKKDFDANAAIFIDTRGEDSYKYEHIKGAINIPANMLDAKLNSIPKDKKIIAYCS
jgi:3-mercaptopyruvate sulfurtransferase SseA